MLVVVDALDASFDPTIYDWLAALGNIQQPSLFLLLTSRNRGFDQRLFLMAELLSLEALTHYEMRNYVIALGVPPDLADQVADLSGGSPLFASLFAREFRSSPDRAEERLQAMVAGEAPIVGLIRARLTTVGPEKAQVLRRALVAIARTSTPLTPAEIANVLDEPLPAVRAAIAAASDLLIADDKGHMSLVHQIFVDVLLDLPEELR
jgi:hypothetical protein